MSYRWRALGSKPFGLVILTTREELDMSQATLLHPLGGGYL